MKNFVHRYFLLDVYLHNKLRELGLLNENINIYVVLYDIAKFSCIRACTDLHSL